MNQKSNSFDKFLEKWNVPVLIFLLILLLFYLFSDFILLKNLYLFKDVANDSLNIFYPLWVHNSAYLYNHGIPMWSFQCGMGQNIFPAEVNDPFVLLLYVMGKNLAYGIIYVELLKIILTILIAFGYFRSLSLSRYVSISGAAIIAFSGYMMAGSSGWYGHSSLVVYGIFLLFAFEQLYVHKRWYLFPIAIVFISTCSLFYVYTFTVFLFLYTLLRFVGDNGWQVKHLSQLFFKMAGLGLLGLCMNAVFIISPLMSMLNSPRVSGSSGHFNKLQDSPVFAFASSIEYLSIILRLFATDILGTGEIFIQQINNQQVMLQSYKGWGNYFESPIFYCSLPVLLLVPQIFIFLSRRHKILYSIFLSFWCLILVFPFFRYAFYLFSGNYFKGGLNFFIPVIMVFMAMQALQFINIKRKINIALFTGTLIVLLLILNFPYFLGRESSVVQELQIFSSCLLLLYAFIIYMVAKSKYQVVWQTVLLLVLLCELGYLSDITINKRGTVSVKEFQSKSGYNDYTVDALKYIRANDKGFYRVQKEYYSSPAVYESLNDAMVQDFCGTSSYNSFNQQNYIKFLSSINVINPVNESHTRWAPGLVRNPVLQSFASVKYGLSKTDNIYFTKFGYKLVKKTGDVFIYKNLLFIPLGFTCNKYMAQSEFLKLSQLQKGAALLETVIIPDADQSAFASSTIIQSTEIPSKYDVATYSKDVLELKKQTLDINDFSPNHISGTIDLPEAAMLVLTIPYDSGWKAKVDEQQVQIYLVDLGFSGVKLPPGKHVVELTFRPPYLTAGIIISILAVLTYVGCLFFCFYLKYFSQSKCII